MISNFIVHDKIRKEATKQMMHALRNYQIVFATTNIPLLLKCAQHSTYHKCDTSSINTNFLIYCENDLKLDPSKQQKTSLIGK